MIFFFINQSKSLLRMESSITPCHYYHTSHCAKGRNCTYSHAGNPKGICPGGRCKYCKNENPGKPCHYYHTSTCSNQNGCRFSHKGRPQGKCPGESCPICHSHKDIPCHNFHVGICLKEDKCEYSHEGNSNGICPGNTCKVCEKTLTQNELLQICQDKKKSAKQNKEEHKKEEKKSSKDNSDCIKCYSAPCVMAFVPCGHVALCERCHKDYKAKEISCPLCREKYISIVKIYQI